MVLDTYSIDKYINMWTVLIKRKDLLNKHIAHYRAHFRSQDPYFTENLNNYND